MTIKEKISFKSRCQNYLKGDSRSVLAKKNILGSVCVKGFSIIIQLLLIPLTLGYLNPYDYGIWITLNSVLTWINLFDVGLGNGLRNKAAMAFASNDRSLAKKYISTSYFLLAIIAIVIFVFYLIASHWLDWFKILNATTNVNLNQLVIYSLFLFCVSFVLKLVGNVYQALQLPFINDILTLLGSLVSFIIIFILTKTTEGNLFVVTIVFSASPLFVYIIANIITFHLKYKDLRPTLQSITPSLFKDIGSLGIKFFIIQIAALINFTTASLIISNLFGPEKSTVYNISFRYFATILVLLNIATGTLWTAVTDAYHKNDFNWIKTNLQKMIKLWALLSIVAVFMLLISNFVYRIWVGDSIIIPFDVSLLICLFIVMHGWNTTYTNFLNGIGKIRLQLCVSLFSAFSYIFLAFYLGRRYGMDGVLLAGCFSLVLNSVVLPIQLNKLIKRKALGIWNK